MKTKLTILGWFGRGLLLCVLTGIGAGIAWAGVMNPVPGDPVATQNGRISGTLLGSGVHAYYGVPFAQPPLYELRWHAPVPVKPWKGIYNADTKRPACPQRVRAARVLDASGRPDTVVLSEDCLYLNVWTPPNAKAGAKLPVGVYIYGGGFTGGTANALENDGENLASKGIIYVSIAYRVGIFGYMAHPEATAESGHNASGNWAVMDQIAALEWVQKNIAAFGGDPANVTIMGQSAGSESVFTLQLSPLAKGLFAKASGWSGADLAPGGQVPRKLADAEADGVRLQKALKAKNLAEMRSMSWDTVMSALSQGGGGGFGGGMTTRPIVDGYVLPEDPSTIFQAGKQIDVPLLLSSTAHDNGTPAQFFQVKTLADFKQAAQSSFAGSIDEFNRLFPAANDEEARKQAHIIVADLGFGLSNRDWARAHALSGKQPAYLVQFSYEQHFRSDLKWIGDPVTNLAGAYHASDIAFWLGTYDKPDALGFREWTDAARQLSAKMQDVLLAFIKTGKPITSAVQVPRYDPNNEQRIIFDDPIYVEKMSTAQIEFLRTHPIPRPQQGGPQPAAPQPGAQQPAAR